MAAAEFFASVPALPWDSAAARAYGSLRAEQERKGRPLSTEDLMIAAHATRLQGLILVTHDSVFSFVDGLETDRLDNWIGSFRLIDTANIACKNPH